MSDPAARLYRLATGHFVSRALRLVATLGLADLLTDGPRPLAELAAATGMHAPSLGRVLRLLVAEGIFAEAAGAFALTPLGAGLRRDAAGSSRATVLHFTGPRMEAAWADLEACVRTGEPAHRRRGVTDPFADPSRTPEERAIFDAAMGELARTVAAAVASAYDFSAFRTIVDVGGGSGALLVALLERHGALRGIVLDRPAPVDRARRRIAEAGLGDRGSAVPGDFFDEVPAGGDAYLLKHVLHDWDDARATAILAACRRAMAPASRLLIIEGVYPTPVAATPESRRAAATDVNMLVSTGGRQRSAEAFRTLLEGAGFALTRIVPTASPVCIVEAARIDAAAGIVDAALRPLP